MELQLKALRLKAGLTQPDVGRYTGLSANRISSYEKGKREPDIDTLEILSDFFGVTVDYMIGRNPDSFEQIAPLNINRLGERLKEFRIQRNISKDDLAKSVRISPEYLSLIECGAKIPKLETCILIFNSLNISADAALMDSLFEGYIPKANYIRDQIETLLPEDRISALEILETVVKSYQKRKVDAI